MIIRMPSAANAPSCGASVVRVGKPYDWIGPQRKMQKAVSLPSLTCDSLKYYVICLMHFYLGMPPSAIRRRQVIDLLDGKSLIEVVLDFLEAINWKDERKPKWDRAGICRAMPGVGRDEDG